MAKPKEEKILRKKEKLEKAKKAAVKVPKAKTAKRAPGRGRIVVKAKKQAPAAAKRKPALKKVKPAGTIAKELKEKQKPTAEPRPELREKPKPTAEPRPELREKPKPTAEPRPELKEKPKPAAEPTPELKEKPKPITEQKPVIEEKAEIKPQPELKELELKLPITLKDLAVKLQEKPSVIIKTLMDMGIMAGINQSLDEQTALKLCEKYHFRIKKAPQKEELILKIHQEQDLPANRKPRAPVVTLMGHVDHGKTSLLDAIRKSKVVELEHGGITQHIGAYRVILPHGEITFLDTPGHEAFTAMRSRGASITDIVVLVVAADDGIMPQTQEAIDHARAAAVPIIVAINKIDKPTANIDRVKKQLSQLDLTPEDWSGKTITVPISAKTREGIDDLLEMILLEAQMLELKSNPKKPARGVVVEAKMSKGRGPVATLLIQNGTLYLNDNIIVGNYFGKVRAMFDDRGKSVTAAAPSFPVEIIGISDVPQAGERFYVIEDEKQAKELAAERSEKQRQQDIKSVKRISLEDLHAQIAEGKLKELKLIIKADVQGSLEAIKDTLAKLNVTEIKLNIIHAGVGSINPSDAILAAASNALILGFNVTLDERAKDTVAKEGIEVKTYNIIYELANEIKAAIEGLLEPKIKKIFLGRVEVRKVFKLSRAGTVAGCFVTKGKINRTCIVSLVRNGQVVFEGKLSSLKRFKDDVREVLEGYECGITLAGFEDLQEGDIIEAFEIERIARKL